MSQCVLFYISGHGFGHASRQVEVLNALGAALPSVRIIIRSAVPPGLLARTIRVPYELRPGRCDAGIIQSSSLSHDDEATVVEAIAFQRTSAERAGAEVQALGRRSVDLVVGDIPPLAFDVAARLDVPSIAIGNFTWDWIYETHPGMTSAAPWLVPDIRRAYKHATMALELPFSGGFDVFADVRKIPIIARHATRTRAETRAALTLPADRPLALLSFGGYGLPSLNLQALDCLDDWTVVTTDRLRPHETSAAAGAENGLVVLSEAQFVSSGFRYEDLVAACDVVITKPGFGIIAECIANGTSMLYTSRGPFREYDVLVDALPKYVRSRFIEQPDLLAGRWRASLDALTRQPSPPLTMATDGAEVAASIIGGLISGAMRK